MKNIFTFILIFLSLLLLNCSYEFPSSPQQGQDPGSLSLDRVVVLGGSSAAGFMDGALYTEGQSSSFGNILINHINEDSYNQFAINSENGLNQEATEFESNGVRGKYSLEFLDIDLNTILQLSSDGENVQAFQGEADSVNEYAFPGLTADLIDDEIGTVSNQYLSRADFNPQTSLIDQVISKNPSLVIIAFGMEEVLSYTVKGASGDLDPDPDTSISGDAVLPEEFSLALNNLMTRIRLETSAEVVLFNVPDIVNVPYFSEVEYYFNDVSIPDGTLNNFYADFNQAVQFHNTTADRQNRRPIIDFYTPAGQDGTQLVIVDEDLPQAFGENGQEIPKYRQATENDLILYPVKKLRFRDENFDPKQDRYSEFGGLVPLADEYVITPTEKSDINFLVQQYNQTIEGISRESARFRVFDFKAFIRNVTSGAFSSNGVIFSASVQRKGIYSADGIYFNPQGNALLANELINFINSNYDAKLIQIDPNSFRGNVFSN
ncbi:MAG: hypothetical protein JJ892_10125 [Balneola sp.]|nr:hypothetical protein [Balneola sp.]MBO6649446.1 hypothetical protein [Balneola sp.]MBO6711261.1 hypothetical protein [Balneola sp.]MBO6800624.1 hypothetical protein [Balneola sp.]MBO6869196.1 hypothetical protein [Balneola sp.]